MHTVFRVTTQICLLDWCSKCTSKKKVKEEDILVFIQSQIMESRISTSIAMVTSKRRSKVSVVVVYGSIARGTRKGGVFNREPPFFKDLA